MSAITAVIHPRWRALTELRREHGVVSLNSSLGYSDDADVTPRTPTLRERLLRKVCGPRWAFGHLMHLGEVRSIRLVDTDRHSGAGVADDAHVRLIEHFPELQVLVVDSTKLTAESFEVIAEHPGLEYLCLTGGGPVDEGLSWLRGHARIRSLTFFLSEITDDGLSHVTTMPALKYLELNQCHHLEGHPFYQRQWACAGTLRDLRIDCDRLHFQAFFGLEQFENLEYLALNAHGLDSNLDAEFYDFPDNLLGWMPPPVFPELEYARLLLHGEWVTKFLHMQPKLRRVEGYDYSVHDNPERAAWPSREELYQRHLETNRQWHQTPSPRWPWKERMLQSSSRNSE